MARARLLVAYSPASSGRHLDNWGVTPLRWLGDPVGLFVGRPQ